MFKKASKKQCKLRLLLEGPSGSGKTYSALMLAKGFGGKIGVIDTERGSASLYSSEFDFDVCELAPPFTPEKYIEAIQACEKMGYNVLIIDSITHEWAKDGGCVETQSKLGGRFQDWGKVTPRHNKFIDAILDASVHIIATARTKSEFEITKEDGKTKVSKVGTKAEVREGTEFEFTTTLRLNQSHMFEASKDRTHLFDKKEGILTVEHSKLLINWLNDGEMQEKLEKEDNLEVLKTSVESKAVDLAKTSTKDKWWDYMQLNKLTKNEDLIKECKEIFQRKEYDSDPFLEPQISLKAA